MTDEDLVKECRRGSKEAFSELVRRYSRPLTRMILRLIRDEEEARDMSQRVFLKAYEGLPRFLMASSFKTWLYRIALNAVKDHLRKDNPTVLSDEVHMTPDASQSPARMLEEARTLSDVRKAVAELPLKQRLTLELRIYEGMDYKQIARTIGGSAGSARGNFFQAIKALREKLDREK